jgi:hypothetical protein
MNKWVLIGGLAAAPLLDAACDSPLPTQPTVTGSTGGSPTAGYTGGKATAVPQDAGGAGGAAALPEGGVVLLPDGSLDAASACLVEPAVLDASCRFQVPEPDGGVIDVSRIEIYYQAGDGALYQVVANQVSDCQLGWHFTDDTNTEIEICGSTCDRIKSDPNAQVLLYSACITIIFP